MKSNSNTANVLRVMAINSGLPHTPITLMYIVGLKSTAQVQTILRILCELGLIQRHMPNWHKGIRARYSITRLGLDTVCN